MAIIKKFAENLTQNLTTFGTFLVDTDPNSQYFKITEFKDTFTGGKNGFLIEGSEHLKESTEIKIQILDVDGNPVYYEPGNGIPEYYEGTSKLVAVYVYNDTPIGTAKITILGELKTYVDDGGVVSPVPDEWKDVYNVKWERTFQINKLLSNEDNVRFYRRPVVNIDEIVKPIFNNVTTTVVQTGLLSGQAQAPRVGEVLSGYTAPTTYLLEIEDLTNWTGSVVGNTINVPTLGYSANVDSVINNKQVLVTTPYTINGLVSNFLDENYNVSFNYAEGVNNLKTALTGSFAKINLSDLTTFVGDVARVKIFRKSQSDLADYQFVQEIRLESNEILRDLESQAKNEEFYGLFDNVNYQEYWITSSNDVSAVFNQSYLYNSVNLDSVGVNSFYTSKSLDITEGTEYTLTFNLRVGNGEVLAGNYIRAFLSGSRQSFVNTTPTTIQIQQNIATITSDSSLLQKNELSSNFIGDEIENAKLYFEVKGNGWYLADVSLRASQETAYSPDEITFIQSVPRTLPEETFLYRFEFYDINNNFVPVLVEASKTFNGGNLQRIQKGLVFTPRSLQFQFDSGSNPVPPTVVGFTVTKNLLTGSVTYTSQSFDFDGNELFDYEYTASITDGGGYPGLLDDITSDAPTMTVQHFTGSRTDKTIQLIKVTGEVEGFTDTVIFSRVLDGFGGVNYLIRPYRGTQIKNSSTQSLEIQAIRIDGVNDIELGSLTKPEKGWPDKQLHVLSRSLEGNENFINLAFASSSGYIQGLSSGSLGSGEINYNAIFDRDSIDIRRTVYLMSSQSAAAGPAYEASASVLYSIILEDLQDGLGTPVVTYNTDTFNIDPRNESLFRPTFAFATASFFKRGTTEPITASFQVFPSMSLNEDYTPEYWLYYTTQSVDSTISVVAIDEAKRIVPAGAVSSITRSPLSQSKNLTFTFTYTEPYASPSSDSASILIDKTFTIVPQGTPGDETIVFEVTPSAITLAANSRGIVNDYIPSITDIKVKQGARYLSFTGSAASDAFKSHGQFYIASSSIIEQNVKAGNIHFTSSFGVPYTASLIVSQSSNLTDLSGSITYPLVIHPYFTSSIYTASVVVQYTKVLDGPPPIQIVISPTSVAIPADEVGYISSYANANTTIQVKEGDDFLTFTTQSVAPGTWRINSIETRAGSIWNIRTGSLSSSSLSTATINYNRFDYPYVSASAVYTIQVYPFALGSGHEYTSSIYTRTQTFTKNVSVPNARTVELKANPYTINYDRDGYRVSPEGDVELKATAFNTTGSAWFSLFFVDTDGSETLYDGPYFEGVGTTEKTFFIPGTDAAGPEENKTWRVKITDGNPYTSSVLNPYRAEGQLTIAGIKAGADAYKVAADNINTSITAELFDTNLTGTAIKLPTFKGVTQLENVITGVYPAPQATDYDYLYNLIGILGYSSASIYYKSPWITLGSTRVLTNPASMPDITGWEKPAINRSGEVVYKIEFEGYSENLATDPPTRQTEFVTQSFAVQFTEPSAYDVKLQNENASAVYRVSGEIELGSTSNLIRAYRGNYELTNQPLGFSSAQIDAYGSSSYEYQCTVEVTSKSSHITLDNGNLIVGSLLSGTPASMPGITAWSDPENNPTAEIVYGINCEGRQTIYKTQSLAIQFEGTTGPGIVMRGVWANTIDYLGSVETTNQRRDAVIWPNPDNYGETHFWAAISGSGPATLDGNGVIVGAQQPDDAFSPNFDDTDYWQYLGQEEFFVAAKIAIFEESYVKNTINVGTKNGTGAFANIVIAGGRTDPYIAIGQNATIGTSGGSGTTLNPGGSVIGYDRPGIFLGIYEQGAAGTSGRFSIKDTSGNRYVKWDGTDLIMSGKLQAGSMELGTGINGSAGNGLWLDSNNYWYDTGTSFKVGGASNYLEWDGATLTLRGALRQISSGTTEGRALGPWNASFDYLVNDIVSHNGRTWYCKVAHNSGSTPDDEPFVGSNYTTYWGLAADAGTSGTAGTAGATGPGVVYRGEYNGATAYIFDTGVRRDIVKYSGTYYITKANTTGNLPTNTTYWEAFGAQFSSVATDILLAQDAAITRGLVIGTDGVTTGFIRSTGAEDLLGTSGTSGFYLQQDGKFRFGNTISSGKPYIYWDNNILTIRGKIETDDNQISEIGNWQVVDGKFQDADESIVLNANAKVISVNENGVQRVILKQGTISDPTSGGSTITISPPQTDPYLNETYYIGNYYYTEVTQALDTTGFSVSAAGLYSVTVLDWSGYINLALDSNPYTFNGYLHGYVLCEIYDTPDLTGNLINSFYLAETLTPLTIQGQTNLFYFREGYQYSLYFGDSGTYYAHVRVVIDGYISTPGSSAIITGNIQPQAEVFSTSLEQTEIGRDGLLVVANSDNYVKIQRTTSAPIVDIKTDKAYPALRITNANAGGRAIEVLDGDIYLSGTGNNLSINGGWIGTENTAGGVRMGTTGGNSVLMGQSWPSQGSNVANARLRPGNTKFGISGRELIFDSSTLRVKKDIEDYPNTAYQSIKKLRPVLYTPLQVLNTNTYEVSGEEDYQNSYPMPNAKEYIGKQGGFIAEWLDADPEMRRYVQYGVSGSMVTTESLTYDKIVVPLTKAVQILMDKVEALEAHISSSL